MKYAVKAAVLGTGYMGKQYIRILKELAETVIVCSADEKTGRALAAENGLGFYADYKELYEKEELDLVAVCLPTFLHYEATMGALDHGISVLCEKPFASSVEQAAEMVKKAKQKNLQLMVGHCIRFGREYEYLYRCITEQRLGKLLSLHMYRHHPRPTWSVGNWLMDPKLSGGFVRDAHIHDTDILLRMLGVPENVYTSGNLFVCSTAYDYGGDFSVTAAGSWRPGQDIAGSNGYDAVFSQGVVKCENRAIRVYTEDGGWEGIPDTECFPEYFDSENKVENEIHYFLECLTKKRPVTMCLPEDSLNTMFVIAAEEESMKEGKMVRIALSGGKEPGLCI